MNDIDRLIIRSGYKINKCIKCDKTFIAVMSNKKFICQSCRNIMPKQYMGKE